MQKIYSTYWLLIENISPQLRRLVKMAKRAFPSSVSDLEAEQPHRLSDVCSSGGEPEEDPESAGEHAGTGFDNVLVSQHKT